MDDTFAKEYLHNDLRVVRATMLWKLEGLSEYDVRRPLTSTGTNLLGLVKHLSNTEARYFGDVFGRPFPERLPWWDDDAEDDADKWVPEEETRTEIIDRYRRAWAHADILREELDGSTGTAAEYADRSGRSAAALESQRARIEAAARAASQAEHPRAE